MFTARYGLNIYFKFRWDLTFKNVKVLCKGNTYSQKVWSLFAQAVCDRRLACKLDKTSINKLEYVVERNGMPTAAGAIWPNEERFKHLNI